MAVLNFNFFSQGDLTFIVGSFGALAVLIYGAVRSPLAQPRNLPGGHIFSAVIGVVSYQLFHAFPWFAAAFADATAIAVMHATRTLDPPGEATALVAVIGGDSIHDLGFLYVLLPVATGAAIMLIVALMVNNLAGIRQGPALSSRGVPPIPPASSSKVPVFYWWKKRERFIRSAIAEKGISWA